MCSRTRALRRATPLLLVALFAIGACAPARVTPSVSTIVTPLLTDFRARADSLTAAVNASDSTASRGIATTEARFTDEGGVREVRLRHLDTLGASGLLSNLFANDTLRAVKFSILGRRSSVLLVGNPAGVEAATQALLRADEPAPHVLIEATVVQFTRETLRQFALALDQGTKGSVKDAAISLGALQAPAVIFTSILGSANPQGFRASIDALENEELAQVIARPYLSARSGDSANVSIGRDRYVVAAAPLTGGGLSSAQQVSTGVLLRLLPHVLPDSQVRVEISVEQSEFIPTEGNEALQLDKSAAQTVMQIRTGQTIVIGGLSVQRGSRYQGGVPWIGRIPGLSWLFSQRGSDETRRDVVILITPYIWTPGTRLP